MLILAPLECLQTKADCIDRPLSPSPSFGSARTSGDQSDDCARKRIPSKVCRCVTVRNREENAIDFRYRLSFREGERRSNAACIQMASKLIVSKAQHSFEYRRVSISKAHHHHVTRPSAASYRGVRSDSDHRSAQSNAQSDSRCRGR